MIKYIEIAKLHNKWDHKIYFHKDISLLTGRNGTGKTAVIKLAWYLLSGNIERTIREVNFTSVKIETDKCSVAVTCEGDSLESEILIEASIFERNQNERLQIKRRDWPARGSEIDIINRLVAEATGRSFFFPTFRRIEGGFSTSHDIIQPRRTRIPQDLTNALDGFVESISVFDHHFITALSTADLHALLTDRYADASKRTDQIHGQLYRDLTARIKTFTSKEALGKAQPGRYKKTLNELTKLLETAEQRRRSAMETFDKLGKIIQTVFTHRGIQLTNNIVFGDASEAVRAELLSAGEKQMLSFLCYNAFFSNALIIIDEPEISLHPDWQRKLISLLQSQNSGNQFILTTHSPFIYAKFPEKEIPLSNEKGE